MTGLIIATGNSHKLEEFKSHFLGIELQGLDEFANFVMPPETGDTFLDNAIIKAKAVHELTGQIALADDSGLVVDALHGAPGVRSARFVEGSDRDRYLALLNAMKDKTKRSARFVACLAVAGLPPDRPLPPDVYRQDEIVYVHGRVDGVISDLPRGENGFGYDPIFELSTGKTMAQVSPAEKQAQSHRGNAAKILWPVLRDYFS